MANYPRPTTVAPTQSQINMIIHACQADLIDMGGLRPSDPSAQLNYDGHYAIIDGALWIQVRDRDFLMSPYWVAIVADGDASMSTTMAVGNLVEAYDYTQEGAI